jgi:hypothetical protein
MFARVDWKVLRAFLEGRRYGHRFIRVAVPTLSPYKYVLCLFFIIYFDLGPGTQFHSKLCPQMWLLLISAGKKDYFPSDNMQVIVGAKSVMSNLKCR